ncbi:MAG TPA: MotA/TolQ/ExbB proton channel family protein [Hyphomicrobiales bacterium]|nr:MotA/TolQ/ExbB proton channel family protein [Hyphomicrobiales bacterium]
MPNQTFGLLEAVAALIAEGGPFVFAIFATGVLMWAMIAERYIYFMTVLPGRIRSTLSAWEGRAEHESWSARQIRRLYISRLHSEMTAGFPIMQVLVPLSPLLGLVGTVSGMLEVFDSMALRGSADARTMASGVSHAMICTMTGLAVSISGLYPMHYFRTRAREATETVSDKLEY